MKADSAHDSRALKIKAGKKKKKKKIKAGVTVSPTGM